MLKLIFLSKRVAPPQSKNEGVAESPTNKPEGQKFTKKYDSLLIRLRGFYNIELLSSHMLFAYPFLHHFLRIH